MGVVGWEETVSGRSVSGSAREMWTYNRSFLIKTDSTNTSLLQIANAVGVGFGQPHPDDPISVALKFDCKAVSGNPLYYELNVEYGFPAAEDNAGDPGDGTGGGGTGIGAVDYAAPPGDVWSGSSQLATTGVMALPKTEADANAKPDPVNTPVMNTAGILFADITCEVARYTLTLARSYRNTSFLGLLAQYTNAVNSADWAGCKPWTWLCKGARWERATQSAAGTPLMYYRVSWEFEYNPLTWKLVLNSVGYQELVGGNYRPITTPDAEGVEQPVTEPWPLTATGTKAAVGTAPAQITYYPHTSIDFQTAFGNVY